MVDISKLQTQFGSDLSNSNSPTEVEDSPSPSRGEQTLKLERDWVESSVYLDGSKARNQALFHQAPPDDLNNTWMKSAEHIEHPQRKRSPIAIGLSRAAFFVSSKLSQVLTFFAVRKMNDPAPLPPHRQQPQPLAPACEVDPKLDFKNIELSTTIAQDEVCHLEKLVFAVNRAIAKATAVDPTNIPQMSTELDQNMRRAMAKCLFGNIEALLYPQTPNAIANMRDDVVAAVALAGPFAGYITKVEEPNSYRIDLSKMCDYPVKEGQAPLGFIAEMHYDEATEKMVVDWIDLPAENMRVAAADVYSNDPAVRERASKRWQRAQRIAMASMSTHMTTVRHLVGCHLKVGEVFSALTHTHLSDTNPVAHLLNRFLYRVQATNHYRVSSLTAHKTAALPIVFSYAREVLRDFIDDSALEFDLARMDPREDAKQRNMADGDIKYPHLENVGEIWDEMQTHVRDYVKTFYKDDAAVQNDAELRSWFDDVGKHVRGARDYAGPLGVEALVKLMTVVMYSEAIEHEHVGAGMVKDYVLLPEIPSSVRMNGDLPSQAEFQTLAILLALTSLPAASGRVPNPGESPAVKPFFELLSDDYPGMGDEGLEVMRRMRDKLAAIDSKLRAEQESVVLPSKCEPSAAA